MKKSFMFVFIMFLFVVGIGSVYAADPPQVTCEDFKDLTRDVWFIIRVAAPALLLVYGAIDMGKAVMSADEKEHKKAIDTFIKRLVICVALFFLPTVVDLIVGIMNYDKITACL